MKRLRLIALFVLGLAMTASMAARLPANYPQGFSHAEKIDNIDLVRQVIVIGDIQFPLASVVLVHEPNGTSHALSRKDIGVEVGINTHIVTGGTIREMWVLPKGYLSSFRPRWVDDGASRQ